MAISVVSGATSDIWTIDPTSKAGRVSIYDTSGNAITSVTLGSTRYLGVSYLQNVIVSSNNSTTANLASSASFTGTSETSLGIGAIQINFKADQQCTLQVQQAQEVPGVNWDIVDQWVVPASTGFAITTQATASALRVVVTNNGGSTTTSLRLQTAIAPSIEALPRALTQNGMLKVALAEFSNVRVTYMATSTAFTPGATPQDVFTLTGSSTRTIRVHKMGIATTQTTAGTNAWFIKKRSTANSAGTSASVTAVPADKNDAAATATALQYTANPTAGTNVGNVWGGFIDAPAPATAGTGGGEFVEIDFWDELGKPIVLRGTGDVIAWNFNGAANTPTNPTSDDIKWRACNFIKITDVRCICLCDKTQDQGQDHICG